MSNPTKLSGQRPDLPPPLLIKSPAATRKWLNTCPHAQTLLALSPGVVGHVIVILPCKQWSCPYCSRRKIAQLSAKTRDAKPNRLMTLTVDPKLYDSPRDAFDKTRTRVPELIRSLRKRFGELEYLRVTELTRRGFPHYHLLLRSAYLPHAVVKSEWNRLTGALIVDLRQVKESFAAYTYLLKYLSKLHKIEWTERHVSYSKRFFPKTDPPPPCQYELIEPEVVSLHPATVLQESFSGCMITRLTASVLACIPSKEDTL